MSNDRMLRKELVSVADDGTYKFTERGLREVGDLARVRCSAEEIADYLGMKHAVYLRLLDPESALFEPNLKAVIDGGYLEFKKTLRLNQLALSETSAAMAKHLGEVYLDQQKVQQYDVTHKHAVIGTLPNYDQSSDDWKRQFGPEAMQKLEEQRKIEARRADAEDAEEIEYIEHDEEREE